jgi:serine/threonine-protein kinase
MVHELIAGATPFTGVTLDELFNKHLKATAPSLETSDPNVTAEFAKLVRRCLAKDPAQRPTSMSDFLADLQTMRVFRVIPQRPGSSVS